MARVRFALRELIVWWTGVATWVVLLAITWNSPLHPFVACVVLVGMAGCLRSLMPRERPAWGLAVLLAGVVALGSLSVAYLYSQWS